MSEIPIAFKSLTRKSVKSHTCCECRKEIHRGDIYTYSSGKSSDREPFSYKQCAICAKAFEAASSISESDDEKPCFTGLREWMLNYFSSTWSAESSINSISKDLNITIAEVRYVLNGKMRE